MAANEFPHTGVTVPTTNYPLVRTPMIAPTKIYDHVPAMSAEEAVQWMVDVIITRNKRKVGPPGPFALGMSYAFPKTTESVINAGYQAVFEEQPAATSKTQKPPANASPRRSRARKQTGDGV